MANWRRFYQIPSRRLLGGPWILGVATFFALCLPVYCRSADTDVIYQTKLLGDNTSSLTDCRRVHDIHNGTEARCEFLRATELCSTNRGIIQYKIWAFCSMGNILPLAVFLMLFWLLFLLLSMALCADKFFCPSLVVISNVLKLSANVTKGVTLLAFGNGAPDLFSAIAALGNGGDLSLGLGGLLGAGLFVTTVVCGSVISRKSFKAAGRPFIRDAIFYLIGVYWLFFILWRGTIHLADAIDIASDIVDHESATDRCNTYPVSNNICNEDVVVWTPRVRSDTEISFEAALEMELMHQHDMEQEKNDEAREISQKEINCIDDESLNNDFQTKNNAQTEEFNISSKCPTEPGSINWGMELARSINPIDVHGWSEFTWIQKAHEIYKSPAVLLMTCTTPVVDGDKKNDGWNRYLRVLQFFTAPTIAAFLTGTASINIGGVFPIYGMTLIAGSLASGIILWMTTNASKPKGHDAFGFFGFFIALIWIYVIATEVVSVLETLGLIFNISDAILGFTILAWANCTGDLISNTLLARQGFPRIGFSACFGGPLFGLMLGFGIPMLMTMIREDQAELVIVMTGIQLILTSFIMISVLSTLTFLVVRNFVLTKHWSLYLFALYGLFFILAILCEVNIILPGWKPW